MIPGLDLCYTDQIRVVHNILYDNGRLVSTVDDLVDALSRSIPRVYNLMNNMPGIPQYTEGHGPAD